MRLSKVKKGGCNASVVQRRIALVESFDDSKLSHKVVLLNSTVLEKRPF
jgi:hypothetical protein